MPSGNNITKSQHYIPQVYLRGFSREYKENKNNKYTIYYYDLNKGVQSPDSIPIKSLCFESFLYELTNDCNEIILPNYLENFFCTLERMFAKYRRMLERKAFNEENYFTKCFLTKEEKEFWVTYMIVQVLRLPNVLELAKELSIDMFGDAVKNNKAKNIALKYCLPFFNELKEGSKEAKIIETFGRCMEKMSFAVIADKSGKLLTSDKPVYIYSQNLFSTEFEKIIFPITSQLCLVLIGGEEKKEYGRKNFLSPIDDGTREMIIKSMIESANEKIFSNHKLNSKELKMIHDVMQDKIRR